MQNKEACHRTQLVRGLRDHSGELLFSGKMTSGGCRFLVFLQRACLRSQGSIWDTTVTVPTKSTKQRWLSIVVFWLRWKSPTRIWQLFQRLALLAEHQILIRLEITLLYNLSKTIEHLKDYPYSTRCVWIWQFHQVESTHCKSNPTNSIGLCNIIALRFQFILISFSNIITTFLI